MKMHLYDAGHMTKIVAKHINGKNPSKYSSPEPIDRFAQNLVCREV